MGLILSKTGAEAEAKPQATSSGPGKFTKFLNFAFPAMNMFCMASDYNDGRSVGGIAGDQVGFMLGNTLAASALSKFKFPGKGLLSAIGGMGAGMFLSPVIGDFMDKHTPIYRKNTKAKSSAGLNAQAMQMQMPPQMAN